MCNMIDADGDGTVTEAEFLDWASCVERCQTDNEEEIITEMFSMIDTDDSGDITISELSEFMMKFGTCTRAQPRKCANYKPHATHTTAPQDARWRTKI